MEPLREVPFYPICVERRGWGLSSSGTSTIFCCHFFLSRRHLTCTALIDQDRPPNVRYHACQCPVPPAFSVPKLRRFIGLRSLSSRLRDILASLVFRHDEGIEFLKGQGATSRPFPILHSFHPPTSAAIFGIPSGPTHSPNLR